MPKATTIHPVILPIPETLRPLRGKKKVDTLRRIAREALKYSAQYSNVSLGPLEKDDNGAPIPFDGNYWSLTHKEKYVAAVTSTSPIGIDIEAVGKASRRLYPRIADPEEWALSKETTPQLFYRFWTAKEAVLKAERVGFTGLKRCRIQKIVDDTCMELTYDDAVWRVTHYWIAEHHIVTITTNEVEIQWHLKECERT